MTMIYALIPLTLMVIASFAKKGWLMLLAFIFWLFVGIYARIVSTAINDLYFLFMYFSFMMAVASLIISIIMFWPRKENNAEIDEDSEEADAIRLTKRRKQRQERSQRIKTAVQEQREREAIY
jgi:hypothetical protein